jgi:hypothetical protein
MLSQIEPQSRPRKAESGAAFPGVGSNSLRVALAPANGTVPIRPLLRESGKILLPIFRSHLQEWFKISVELEFELQA